MGHVKRIRYRHQQDATGCGLACAAMLAGVSYAHVRAQYRALYPRIKGYRTDIRDLRRILESHRVLLGRVRYAKSITRIRSRALVAVRYEPKTGNWHWVVWEPSLEGGLVLDPMSRRRDGNNRSLRNRRPDWYYLIQMH